MVRMSNNSRTALYKTVYSAFGAKSARTARASNDPDRFSTTVTPLVTRMSRQKVSINI